ncbi:hypothetical protein JCM19046_4552 [Bacillus sp. JCM 19046]|nr:hypothetical protein JCM19045_3706 [Bacillus sp. JCM 19045]GAF19868.1 hypothetical protein JCM19046_4552 [Bacillus sp. JCM 19046]
MKRILLIIVTACVVIGAGISLYLYNAIRSPLTDGAVEASNYIENEQLLNQVMNVSFYHGEEGYWVAEGLTDEGDEAFLWLNQNEEEREDPLVLLKEDGITKDNVTEQVANELGVGSFESVRLGLEEGQAIYEFTYHSEATGKVFYYVSFETGDYIKSYSLHTNP